jgi:23S rRNA (guanosine2251-2'-O)-methyltransferase
MRKLSTEEILRINSDTFNKSPKLPVVVVLDNIRSQHNVGSVFRTSDAFRVESLFLCGITASPPNREIQKTALGATESVDWKYFGTTMEAITHLLQENFQIIAVEQTDESIRLDQFVPQDNRKIALVFGNEITGVSEEILNSLDLSIEIPQFGTKHSLNVSIAAGIVIWNIYCHFNNKIYNFAF